ncbi:MAG: prepilin-type N-terminal cleavage/methylation domain-containing protein [Phycisphaerae bacterium]|nr:prepilin-type N-terminal cleavage/methylation domain-containing protein [Phycisphaerae bacterium]
MNQVFSLERAVEGSPGRKPWDTGAHNAKPRRGDRRSTRRPLPPLRGCSEGLSRRKSRAFTLVELLVVIAILTLLISILMPSLSKARERARMAVCKINLKGLGTAFGEYVGANNQWYPASSANGGLPYGDSRGGIIGPEYAWDTILYPYYRNFGLIHCPSDKLDRSSYYISDNVPEENRHPRSYGMNCNVSDMGPSLDGQNNGYWGGIPPYPWPGNIKKASAVTNPAETILLAEMWESNYGAWNPYDYEDRWIPNIYGDYRGSRTGIGYGGTQPSIGRSPTFYHRNDDAANFLFCDGSVMLLDEDDPNVTDENGYYYYFIVKP